MASVKGNIILNGINTITGIIFPVVTFPYAARVLLPDGIGAINFLNSIVSYIVLLTSLGIPMYAVKEIAKYRDNNEKRDNITIEILILSCALCLIGYILVWFLAKFVPQIHEQSALFYVLSLSILFNAIGVNWFYQGIEDFKFITICGIIVRTLSAISLFVFVKDSCDLLIYGLIVVGTSVGNSILNFLYLGKHINFNSLNWKNLKIMRHLKPSFQVFILNLITSLYLQLNLIMLGFMSGDDAVGYFTAGTKISHIGLTVISSICTVLLPRCSNLLKNGDIAGFESVVKNSLNLTSCMSWPMTIGLIVLAVPITIIFCGYEFIPSISVLYITAPTILFISMTSLIGIQILYPQDKINIVIWSVSGGAITNIILNVILIPFYGATGAAISTLIAESVVFIIQIISGKTYCPFSIKNILNFKYLLGSLFMGLSVILSVSYIVSYSLQLIVGICAGAIIYVLFLFIIKDQFIYDLFLTMKKKILHAK